MHGRPFKWVVVAAFAAVVWPMQSNAGLNLWISYHFTGTDAYEDGKYRDAETLLTLAKGETDCKVRLASTLDGLGKVQTALGNYEDANKLYGQALCMREHASGKESMFVPETLNNLGDLNYVAGDKDKGECFYRRALKIEKRDQLNIEVSRSLNGLALVAADKGDYVEAENLLKRAIDIHDKAGRREHPYCATAVINLGVLYTKLGRLDEAGQFFKRAEYIQSRSLGCDHPDVAVRLHAYAGYLMKSGCVEGARCAENHAKAIEAKFAELNAAKKA